MEIQTVVGRDWWAPYFTGFKLSDVTPGVQGPKDVPGPKYIKREELFLLILYRTLLEK